MRRCPSETAIVLSPSSFPCSRNSQRTCSSFFETSRHSARTPHVRSPVSQNSALRKVYPLGAFPQPTRYQLLQSFPGPLFLTPDSAVTMAGAMPCEGGISSGSWPAVDTAKRKNETSSNLECLPILDIRIVPNSFNGGMTQRYDAWSFTFSPGETRRGAAT